MAVEYRGVTRDLRRLADTPFDLLVVGAGIYGATIAWDAALRGLSVAIVDRDDFGGATSANSLKTVHGGLRSLQRGALPEVRQFIRERRTLLRIAPHLVTPLTFVVPTTWHPVRNALVMRIALAMNDAIASDRNEGLLPSHSLHGGRHVSLAELRRVAPDIGMAGVHGGASWCDAQMQNSERVTLEFVLSAAERGAVAANHVEVLSLLRAGDRITGAHVQDRLSGESFDVRARATINVAGPWAAALSATADGRSPTRLVPALSRALNVVTARPAGPCAVGGLSEGRFFFRVPWRGVTMYGTSHDRFKDAPDAVRPREADVASLLADVNRAFPGNPVRLEDVTFVHWGLLPARPDAGRHVQLAKQSVVHDHSRDGTPGLVTVVGVRYTTARQTAEDAVGLVFRLLGHASPPSSPSSSAPLLGARGYDESRLRATLAAGAPPAAVQRLISTYGQRALAVAALMKDDAGLAVQLGVNCPVTAAEVVFAVREEMACTLADVLLRRTEAGTAGPPGDDAVLAAAGHLQRALGWDAHRTSSEITALRDRYRLAT
jgi:glycerol-3-phosphate dehydrogenase